MPPKNISLPILFLFSSAISCLSWPAPAAEPGPDLGSTQAITLQETLVQALQANPDIGIERLNVAVAEAQIEKEKAKFDLTLNTGGSLKNSRSPLSTATGLAATPLWSKTAEADAGAGKKALTGASWNLTGNISRVDDLSQGLVLNPFYASALNLSVDQPLLKGAGLFINKSPILLARNDAAISKAKFRQLVLDTLRDVESSYWDLYLQWQNMRSQLQALAAAEKLAAARKRMAELKVAARVDLLEAESEVAGRKEGVLQAREQLALAEDQLKAALNYPEPSKGEEPELLPSEEPKFLNAKFLLEEEIERALNKRQDFLAAKRLVESQNIRVRVAKDSLKPALDLQAGIGKNSLSGYTLPLFYSNGTPVVSPFAGDIGTLVRRLLNEKYYQWNVGVVLEFPWGFHEARADLAQKQAAAGQALIQLVRQERTVIREVRTALKLLAIERQRVQAAIEARKLAEEQLTNGERQLELGATNITRVILFIDDLATAQLNENGALVAYVKALSALERADGSLLEGRGISLPTTQ